MAKRATRKAAHQPPQGPKPKAQGPRKAQGPKKTPTVFALLALLVGCAVGTAEAPGPPQRPCTGELDCNIGETCFEGFCTELPEGICLTDTDCISGEICEAEACRIGCRDDGDCINDQTCDLASLICQTPDRPDPPCGGPCPDGSTCNQDTDTCEPDEVEGCMDDAACGQGQICVDEACINGCRDDDGCSGDQVCRDEVCGPQCLGDGDCGDNEVCEGGSCQPLGGCDNDAQCGQGRICNDRDCVEGCRDDNGCAGGERCLGERCICDNDENEGNNERQSATPIAAGDSAQGRICPNDLDFFVVEVEAGCTVSASIAFDNNLGDLDIQLRDNQGGLLADENNGGDTEQVQARIDETGEVFIQIFGVSQETAGGYTLGVEIVSCENGGDGLLLSEVYYDAPSGDNGLEWVEIFNASDAAIDLAGFSLGNGGVDYTTSTVQLSGVIGPGECFVIGGATSNETNANPVFDQAIDFNPDFQNSGGDADGVALFNIPASAIQNTTIPIDAVIYGGQNQNGLLGPEGGAGAVDVGDADDGQSIERTAGAWRIQASPTPNNCDPLR